MNIKSNQKLICISMENSFSDKEMNEKNFINKKEEKKTKQTVLSFS